MKCLSQVQGLWAVHREAVLHLRGRCARWSQALRAGRRGGGHRDDGKRCEKLLKTQSWSPCPQGTVLVLRMGRYLHCASSQRLRHHVTLPHAVCIHTSPTPTPNIFYDAITYVLISNQSELISGLKAFRPDRCIWPSPRQHLMKKTSFGIRPRGSIPSSGNSIRIMNLTKKRLSKSQCPHP